jgi:MscS family membrane protein
LIFLVFLYAGVNVLPVPTEPVDIRRFVAAVFHSASIVVVAWFVVRLTDALTVFFTEQGKEKSSSGEDEAFLAQQLAEVAPIAHKAVRTFVYIVAGVMVLQEMGYSVGSLAAAIGVLTFGVPLASKDTLTNMFGYLVILVDRPFKVGDWIEVGSVEGTVEEIGLRVTRIRTFPKSLITLPNAGLTTTAINNWSRMTKRRVKTTLGLTYSTSPAQMRECVKRIRQMLENHPDVQQDQMLVYFYEYGASSLDIYLYYFTTTTNWLEHMAAREDTLLKMFEIVQELGLEVAFPTRTVHLIKEEQPDPMG